MIFSKRKTIGLFICKVFTEFDNAVFRTLAREGKRLNYDVVVFTTAGYFWSMSDYDLQEKNIFRFAPVEKLDGIIVVPESYNEGEIRNGLFDMIRDRVHCPVVAIRHDSDELPCVYTDEREAIRPVIRHLIEDHGLRRICFQTGHEGHAESRMRMEVFIEEMKAHGLPVSEKSVCPGNLWLNCGEIAYNRFFSDPGEQPEAVICANDYMAAGLIRVLQKNGIQVPEDVIVTGFDNIVGAAPDVLSLTTIEPDYEAMVVEAMNFLDRQIRGEESGKTKVPLGGKLILGESCGCGQRKPDYFRNECKKKTEELERINDQDLVLSNLSTDLGGCEDLSVLHQVLISARVENPTVRDQYLCLFGEPDNLMEESGTRACLVHAICDHQDCGMPMTSFDRVRLLPMSAERADEPQLFYVKLLHQMGHNFGYNVMQYDENAIPTRVFVQSNVLLSIALANIYRHREIMRLYEERRLSSITDMMTGLLNRRGMLERIKPIWPQMRGRKIAFVCIDMDYLKHINDTYGHSEGDYAIRLVAQAIQAAVSEREIGARVGGDEFIVFLPSTENGEVSLFTERFNEELEELNREGKREFTVGASVGYAVREIRENVDAEQCIQASDREMYLVKARRHAGRVF
ncbi:MAG: GGDEF domain-containing protein [Clostridia bacterium]|nr:GGDEF domain-containing protein [Clostridia bacterium]